MGEQKDQTGADCAPGHCRTRFPSHSRCQRCCVCGHVEKWERKNPCPKTENGRHKWGMGPTSQCVCQLCGMSYTEHGRRALARREERIRTEGVELAHKEALAHYEGRGHVTMLSNCYFCNRDLREITRKDGDE